MKPHMRTCVIGETLAREYFKRKGHLILHTNWRSGKSEIDIISAEGNHIHFIEVKTMRTAAFGYPEAHVTNLKITRMREAMEAYMEMLPEHFCSLNILSIILFPVTRYQLFENCDWDTSFS